MYKLIMGTLTIQYLKSKHLNVTLDFAFRIFPQPNHQLELFIIYAILTISCHFTIATVVQARVIPH